MIFEMTCIQGGDCVDHSTPRFYFNLTIALYMFIEGNPSALAGFKGPSI